MNTVLHVLCLTSALRSFSHVAPFIEEMTYTLQIACVILIMSTPQHSTLSWRLLSCSEHHHHSVHWHVSGVICLASHHFRGVPALSSLTLGWVMLSLFEHANRVWLLYELQTTVCAVAVSESWCPNDHRDNHLGLTLWSCRHVWLRSPADQLCCGFFILLHEPYRQLRLKTCSLFRRPQQESGSIRLLHCFLESPRINFKGKYHKHLPPY